jgi:hypothetical protein
MNTTNRVNILRKIADLLEAHPEIETPYLDTYDHNIDCIRFQFTSHGERAADAAAAVMKAFPGPFTKRYVGDDFYLYGKFEGVTVDIRTRREDVCVARQVGITTQKVRDPEAAAAVPFVEVEIPVFEYDCKPILSSVA